MRGRFVTVGVILGCLAIAFGYPLLAGPGAGGVLTNKNPMIDPVASSVTVKALLTVGESVDGTLFEGFPDGIAVDHRDRGKGLFDVYVNHEQSQVPRNNVLDPVSARLTHLEMRERTARLADADYAIDQDDYTYVKFCSNSWSETLDLVFTVEENTSFLNRQGTPWPADSGDPSYEQAGLVVVHDPSTGASTRLYGMGRMAHENAVAIPGYADTIVMTTDDTGTPPGAQVYLYKADNKSDLLADGGRLYAFKSNNSSINDYGDLDLGDSVSGQFLIVPQAIAKGGASDLEDWSNDNNVFQFIRLEDLAYDRNDSNIVYIADTSDPRAIADPTTGRLKAGASSNGPYQNGRVFKMVLDPNDPLQVDSFSILIEGDDSPAKTASEIHQPDNLETTPWSLMIQEDPGSHNQYNSGESGATTARIWKYDLTTGTKTVVAKVDQSGLPGAKLGVWESSGIVDVSRYFGRGAFLVTVQAHGLVVGTTTTVVNPEVSPANPDATNTIRRESGQLLLLRVPGA